MPWPELMTERDCLYLLLASCSLLLVIWPSVSLIRSMQRRYKFNDILSLRMGRFRPSKYRSQYYKPNQIRVYEKSRYTHRPRWTS